MATAVELNDEEIEESLLWTDDEDVQGEINLSDEEFLLNDPIKTIASKLRLQNKPVNGDNDVHMKPSNIDTEQTSDDKLSETLNSTINDGIDLNVTFDTRTALDTTVTSECGDVEKTVIEASNNLDKTLQETSNNSTKNNSKPVVPSSDGTQSTVPEVTMEELKQHIGTVKDNIIDVSDITEVENAVAEATIVETSSNVATGEFATIDKVMCENSKDDQKDNAMVISSDISTDASESTLKASSDQGAACVTVDETMGDDFKENNSNDSSLKANTASGAAMDSAEKGDTAISLKRAKSVPLLSEESSCSDSKRMRHISVPITAPAKEGNTETGALDKSSKKEKVDNDKTNEKSTDDKKPNAQAIVDKKKQIIHFDISNYSKDSTTNPYICKKCAKKVEKQKEFETHLIAHHAMSLVIKDFNVNLHQQYLHKREKISSQGIGSLPRLGLMEGHINQDLLDDYNSNVKFMSPQQYLCKICENIYSSKNLIVEHLKSPKHLLKKIS